MSNKNANAQKSASEDDVSLHLRYGAQGFAIFTGIVAVAFGMWNCIGVITLTILSIFSGIFLICVGIMLIVNETHLCGQYQRSGGLEYNRNKAIGYCIAAIPAFLIGPSFTSLVASVMILITGIMYGIISFLEKKHEQPQQPHQQAAPVYIYKAPHEEVAVSLTSVQVEPPSQPAENQETVEIKNELESPNDHEEPLYPSLNI